MYVLFRRFNRDTKAVREETSTWFLQKRSSVLIKLQFNARASLQQINTSR